MVHDNSQADIWYHDTINSIQVMCYNIQFAVSSLQEEGKEQGEATIALKKALQQYPKIKANLYCEYLDKLRMEASKK